ncbi:unnamed protein product [Mycena citricolor]|uniref:DDE Tnp4 domain-containing protein n=1 Tax=Mycena citricolor TaxID=2018698 RepID=A0AAD2Q5W1_9AGAR|nr:unnamed protein product [Mycena citricolor]
MDGDAFMWMKDAEEMEDDMEEEDVMDRLTAFAAVMVGIEEARRLRAERRLPSRLYLCRPQLMPNPRFSTPWQVLHGSRSDRAFITTMGFDTATFDSILDDGFAAAWVATPIPRNDVSHAGKPCPGGRSLDAAGALGLALHFLTSTMREISLQQIFALIPTTVSRYINFACAILLNVLRKIPDARIAWPVTVDEFRELNTLIVKRHPVLTGAFAGIDGLELLSETSSDPEIENETYNGWKCNHCNSNVLVFSPKGIIIAASINCPGSWHDSRVARPIYEKLRENTPAGFYLVADTAFPRGTGQIEGKIRAPIKSGQTITGREDEIQERLEFDRQLLAYRQTVEWGMRSVQGAFGRLRIPLDINDNNRRGNMIELCLRLHNLRTNRVGHNQIRTVYMPVWRESQDDEEVWSNFEQMLFSDQRRKDRVARYHNFPDYVT